MIVANRYANPAYRDEFKREDAMQLSLSPFVGGLGLSLLLACGTAMAQAPEQQKTQAPGYYRLAVGDYEVTALCDGYNDLSPKLLNGLTQSRIRALH